MVMTTSRQASQIIEARLRQRLLAVEAQRDEAIANLTKVRRERDEARAERDGLREAAQSLRSILAELQSQSAGPSVFRMGDWDETEAGEGD